MEEKYVITFWGKREFGETNIEVRKDACGHLSLWVSNSCQQVPG